MKITKTNKKQHIDDIIREWAKLTDEQYKRYIERKLEKRAKKTNREIYTIFQRNVQGGVYDGFWIAYQIGMTLAGADLYWVEGLEENAPIFKTKNECYAYFKEEYRRIEKEVNATWDMTDEEKEEYFERMEQK